MPYYVQVYSARGRLLASGASPDLQASRKEVRFALGNLRVAGARILEAEGLYVEDLGMIPEPKPAHRAPVVAKGRKRRALSIPGKHRKS